MNTILVNIVEIVSGTVTRQTIDAIRVGIANIISWGKNKVVMNPSQTIDLGPIANFLSIQTDIPITVTMTNTTQTVQFTIQRFLVLNGVLTDVQITNPSPATVANVVYVTA